jgi:hypothetical protein
MKTDYLDFTYYEMPVEERRKLDIGDIYDNKIQCRLCGYIIRSKNRHDFIRCKCGECSVDGGSWYQKCSAKNDINNVISRIKYFKYRNKNI